MFEFQLKSNFSRVIWSTYVFNFSLMKVVASAL